jgi:hypothetical protein
LNLVGSNGYIIRCTKPVRQTPFCSPGPNPSRETKTEKNKQHSGKSVRPYSKRTYFGICSIQSLFSSSLAIFLIVLILSFIIFEIKKRICFRVVKTQRKALCKLEGAA